ncbi:MAG: hypothetical protein KC733_08835, partial [Candidatus Omnitrophica bacterium]|nr:hypothetical protein [Candidatus Omnitrophota bacterium]
SGVVLKEVFQLLNHEKPVSLWDFGIGEEVAEDYIKAKIKRGEKLKRDKLNIQKENFMRIQEYAGVSKIVASSPMVIADTVIQTRVEALRSLRRPGKNEVSLPAANNLGQSQWIQKAQQSNGDRAKIASFVRRPQTGLTSVPRNLQLPLRAIARDYTAFDGQPEDKRYAYRTYSDAQWNQHFAISANVKRLETLFNQGQYITFGEIANAPQISQAFSPQIAARINPMIISLVNDEMTANGGEAVRSSDNTFIAALPANTFTQQQVRDIQVNVQKRIERAFAGRYVFAKVVNGDHNQLFKFAQEALGQSVLADVYYENDGLFIVFDRFAVNQEKNRALGLEESVAYMTSQLRDFSMPQVKLDDVFEMVSPQVVMGTDSLMEETQGKALADLYKTTVSRAAKIAHQAKNWGWDIAFGSDLREVGIKVEDIQAVTETITRPVAEFPRQRRVAQEQIRQKTAQPDVTLQQSIVYVPRFNVNIQNQGLQFEKILEATNFKELKITTPAKVSKPEFEALVQKEIQKLTQKASSSDQMPTDLKFSQEQKAGKLVLVAQFKFANVLHSVKLYMEWQDILQEPFDALYVESTKDFMEIPLTKREQLLNLVKYNVIIPKVEGSMDEVKDVFNAHMDPFMDGQAFVVQPVPAAGAVQRLAKMPKVEAVVEEVKETYGSVFVASSKAVKKGKGIAAVIAEQTTNEGKLKYAFMTPKGQKLDLAAILKTLADGSSEDILKLISEQIAPEGKLDKVRQVYVADENNVVYKVEENGDLVKLNPAEVKAIDSGIIFVAPEQFDPTVEVFGYLEANAIVDQSAYPQGFVKKEENVVPVKASSPTNPSNDEAFAFTVLSGLDKGSLTDVVLKNEDVHLQAINNIVSEIMAAAGDSSQDMNIALARIEQKYPTFSKEQFKKDLIEFSTSSSSPMSDSDPIDLDKAAIRALQQIFEQGNPQELINILRAVQEETSTGFDPVLVATDLLGRIEDITERRDVYKVLPREVNIEVFVTKLAAWQSKTGSSPLIREEQKERLPYAINQNLEEQSRSAQKVLDKAKKNPVKQAIQSGIEAIRKIQLPFFSKEEPVMKDQNKTGEVMKTGPPVAAPEMQQVPLPQKPANISPNITPIPVIVPPLPAAASPLLLGHLSNTTDQYPDKRPDEKRGATFPAPISGIPAPVLLGFLPPNNPGGGSNNGPGNTPKTPKAPTGDGSDGRRNAPIERTATDMGITPNPVQEMSRALLAKAGPNTINL